MKKKHMIQDLNSQSYYNFGKWYGPGIGHKYESESQLHEHMEKILAKNESLPDYDRRILVIVPVYVED